MQVRCDVRQRLSLHCLPSHRLGADGQTELFVDKTFRTNGLILSPDQKTLVVADMKDTKMWSYQIQPNGDLADKTPKYTLRKPEKKKDSGADGMTIDSAGRIYCTSHLGLQVFAPDGELIGIIDKPQKSWLANVVFAGPELDLLYVTCRDKVFMRKINAKGIRYFDVGGQK